MHEPATVLIEMVYPQLESTGLEVVGCDGHIEAEAGYEEGIVVATQLAHLHHVSSGHLQRNKIKWAISKHMYKAVLKLLPTRTTKLTNV